MSEHENLPRIGTATIDMLHEMDAIDADVRWDYLSNPSDREARRAMLDALYGDDYDAGIECWLDGYAETASDSDWAALLRLVGGMPADVSGGDVT